MAAPIIRIKRSAVPGKRPEVNQLPLGELALNTNDGKLFITQNSASAGIGSTVVTVNPWDIGIGSSTYNISFNVGNVGIGSTIPTSKLSVNGDGLFVGVVTAAGFNVGPVSGSGANFTTLYVSGITTTGTLNVGLGGTVITTSRGPSRVGINSTVPQYTLDVGGDINFTGNLYKNGSLFGIGINSGGTVIAGSGTTIINFVGSAISSITSSSGIVTVSLQRGQFTRTTTAFTATANQSSFSITYTPGYIDVYVNGVRLTSSEYTATNGTSVVLATPCFGGETVDITVFRDDGLYSGSKWTPGNGNDIYRLDGNVGIGTHTTTAKFDIEGNLGVETTVTTIASTSATTIDSMSSTVFRSARFQVQITQGSSYQSTDLMVVHDGTNASLVEYGTVATGDYLGSYSASVSGGSLLLQVTMTSATSATVKVVRYGITV